MNEGKTKSTTEYIKRIKYSFAHFWRTYIFFFICTLLLVGLAIYHRNSDDSEVDDIEYVSPESLNITINKELKFNRHYSKTFCDKNAKHIDIAKRINPHFFEKKLSKDEKQKLSKVKTNQYYSLARMNYSSPYLVPSAKLLLDNIGKDFAASLKAQGYPAYKFVVTSLLRTVEDQNRLTKWNRNATRNISSHSYGTTFDISWSRFKKVNRKDRNISDSILKKVLAGVLIQYREGGLCYIVHERKQACFHITVRF